MTTKTDKTHDLVNLVLRAVLDGQYGTGDPIPSERDMARRIGVSRVTVRRAYDRLQKAAVLERRHGQGTRVATAARGCTDEIRYVALLTPWGAFGSSFLRAMEAEASAIRAMLVLKTTEGHPNKDEAVAIDLVARGIRNLVIRPGACRYRLETFERLRVVGTNMVFFDRIRPGAVADFVGMDNLDAVRRLIEQGMDDGCDRFDFVGYENSCADSEVERLDAFRTLCSKYGIRHACHEVPYGPDTGARLRQVQRDGLLGTGHRPGIVCVHDPLALQVRSVAGGDTRLYSIDGTPEALAAGITTVEQPLAQMARAALRLLSEQQVKGADWRAREVRFRGKLRSGRQDTQQGIEEISHENIAVRV